MLKIAVKNTDEDIANHKLDQQIEKELGMLGLDVKCNKCRHKWSTNISAMIDDNSCPKCGK